MKLFAAVAYAISASVLMTQSGLASDRNEIKFGVATVAVSAPIAYVCAHASALLVAGNDAARQEMGDFSYTQALLLGQCAELHHGDTLQIRSVSEAQIESNPPVRGRFVQTPGGCVKGVCANGFAGWARDFDVGSLHTACRKGPDLPPLAIQRGESAPMQGATTCGLEY